MLHRRDLLSNTIIVGTATALARSGVSADEPTPPSKLIDTNLSLFQWPFRRLPLDEVTLLIKKMQALGITTGWAGSFEGLLHRDVTGVNQRLADACQQHPELVAIGSVNLELPDWQGDLRRCFQTHNMPGVRLHPNYHGYTLADARFAELLAQCAAAGRFVQIAVAMEDSRTQHPMLRVSDVDLAPLPSLMRQTAGAKVQLLNHRGRGLAELLMTAGVYCDCSRVDGTDGIAKLVRSVPGGRVLFGTHAPFLIPESTLIRTYESDLSESRLRLLMSQGAEELSPS